VRKQAVAQGWPVEFEVTTSPEDLARRARRAAEAGLERILVLGGDGTFQVLLNALRAFPEVTLGVLPAGGGNDLASALGLPSDTERAAEMLQRSEACFLDAVCVRNAAGIERLYTGGGGVGLDAEAARYAGGVYRNLGGRFRYLLSAIRALFGFHPLHVRLETDAPEALRLEAKALVVAVLNTPTYGAGLRLAPEARIDDGKLDLVLVEDLGLGEILRLLPVLAARGKLETGRVRRFRVARVWIETEGAHSFQGDGELLGTTPVEITVVPRAVRVLCPLVRANR